jgi:ubiquinone biosynthesis protein
LPEQQKLQFELQQQQLRQQHRSSQLVIVGATLIIAAALLPIYQTHWWPSTGCLVLGFTSWIVAWRFKIS